MVFADSNVLEQDVMQFLVSVRAEGGAAGGNSLNYKCTLCGKISKSKWSMQRHMILIHTKPTNDVCKFCSKVFKHKYYLNEHIRARECLSQMYFKAPNTTDNSGASTSSM